MSRYMKNIEQTTVEESNHYSIYYQDKRAIYKKNMEFKKKKREIVQTKDKIYKEETVI